MHLGIEGETRHQNNEDYPMPSFRIFGRSPEYGGAVELNLVDERGAQVVR
jgi:hypothetical protein